MAPVRIDGMTAIGVAARTKEGTGSMTTTARRQDLG
jgi:hypothetical protein